MSVLTIPQSETIRAYFGADCGHTFWARAYPDPNQDGSPGILVDVSGATFHARLEDAFTNQFVISTGVFDLGSYVSGSSGGAVGVSIPQATLEQLPVGTHRYRIAMRIGSGPMATRWAGPFLIVGPDSQSGYASASATGLGPFTIYGEVPSVSDRVLTIMNSTQQALTITGLRDVRTTAGSLVLTLSLNGSPIGGMSGIGISTSPVDISPTGGAVAIPIGSLVEMTLAGSAPGTTRLSYALTGTR